MPLHMTAAETTEHSLTQLLHAWRDGSGTAFASLLDQVYAQLKQIAARRISQAAGQATLSPTELLHEALLGLMPAPKDWNNRAHFFATISLAIRSVLVDRARARGRNKRGGGMVRVTLSGTEAGEESMMADLLALDSALNELEKMDPRCAEVLHLTYFAGLDRQQIADILKVSLSSVDRELRFARAWLTMTLGTPGSGSSDTAG